MWIKITVFLLLFAFLGCQDSNVQTQNQELPQIQQNEENQQEEKNISYTAWNNTNWGMSPNEVNQLFNNGIILRTEYSNNDEKRYDLKKFEIEGNFFDVYFYFTQDKLSQITLYCYHNSDNTTYNTQSKSCSDNYFDVSKLLAAKYGNSIEESTEKNPVFDKITTIKKWETETNLISFKYTNCIVDETCYPPIFFLYLHPNIDFASSSNEVALTYKPNPKTIQNIGIKEENKDKI